MACCAATYFHDRDRISYPEFRTILDLKPSEIEAWALQIVDGLRRTGTLEDSRVELKQQWIAPEKAARRIAGHLNAAGGERLLWLIGVTESGAVQEMRHDDYANWWPAVVGHFDGPAPSVMDVVVFHEDAAFIALALVGAQPPYLVRNPVFGTPGGGSVELEVPWRELTRTRSARHSDLLRVLAPRAQLPEIEVVNATLLARGAHMPSSGNWMPLVEGEPCSWSVEVDLYCVPASERPLVLPIHRMSVALIQPEPAGTVQMRALARSPDNPMRFDSSRDHVLSEPGRLEIHGAADVQHHVPNTDGTVCVEVRVKPAWISQVLVVRTDYSNIDGVIFRYKSASVAWVDC